MADNDETSDAEARARVERERNKARDEDVAKKEAARKAEEQRARGQRTAEEVADLAVGQADTPLPSEPNENVGWSPPTEREEAQAVRGITDVGNILVPSAPAPAPPPPAPPAAETPSLAEIGQQSAEGRGCLGRLGIPGFAILLVLAVAVGAVVLSSRDDGTTSNTAGPTGVSSCAESGVRRDGLVLIACDDPAGDLSGFAGHYVLSEGLDDPSGLDASGQGGLPNGSTGSGSATIDIDNSGTITGGSYHASYDGGGCHRTGDGDGATGSVSSAGTGSVIFQVSHSNSGETCQSDSFRFDMMYQFGISEGVLYMCRSNMETLTTCAAAYPRLVARFTRT